MRNLTTTICLTIAVLLGSAGMSTSQIEQMRSKKVIFQNLD
jgi:hypothetical protein